MGKIVKDRIIYGGTPYLSAETGDVLSVDESGNVVGIDPATLDTKVTQTQDDSTNSFHEVLIAGSTSNTTATEGAKKTSGLVFNPLQQAITIGSRRANSTIGEGSFASGYNVEASLSYTHAEGVYTEASGVYAHAEGNSTTASEDCSHAEGDSTEASGYCAHAEGHHTTASSSCTHAEGNSTTASGTYAHAEGNNTIASGGCSHAEGDGTEASGTYSHAEGYYTTASNYLSHAEGSNATASGIGAHTEGNYTEASGSFSHVEGNYTISNHFSQHVFGEYNVEDDSIATSDKRGNYIEIVGNGTKTNNVVTRSNARTLDWDGNEVLAGKLTLGAAPTNNMDVATKLYVDTGLGSKQDTLTAGTGINIDANNVISATGSGTITDVQVDGTSVVTSGVAEIDLTSKADAATTLSGYGITDAKIESGTITLGSNTITPITSHQSVTDWSPTLSWETRSKVATIGGIDIHVAMPSDPVSDKVSKSGDTMTGTLHIDDALLKINYHDENHGAIAIQNKSYAVDTSSNNGIPSGAFHINGLDFVDSNKLKVGGLQSYAYSSGAIYSDIFAYDKKTDGSSVSNRLRVGIAKNGTCLYEVTDPAAFRSAIGAGTSSTNTTYTIATGDSNGQIKVTPSSGSAYNVSVKGLGSAAYLTADTAASANTVVKRTGDKYIYATYYNSNISNENINSYTNDVAVMFTSNDKWIRRTSRLNFAKYLTNQQIASPGYFVTLTDSWGSFGYSTPAQARSGLGLGSMATQNTGSWEPVHPYLWRNDTRNNMSHPSGMNYWTMPTAFPAKSGYSRFAIIHKCTDRHITFHWWALNGSNQVVVYTNNWSGSTLTFSLEVLLIYLKDSNKW